jgi:hypothetical protein
LEGRRKKKKKSNEITYAHDSIDGFDIYAKEESVINDDESVIDAIENFYRQSTLDTFIRKYCILCRETNTYDIDNLLRFRSFKEFLRYLKYFLLNRKDFLEGTIFHHLSDHEIKQYIANLRAKLRFKKVKVICKHCFMTSLLYSDPGVMFKKAFIDAVEKERNVNNYDLIVINKNDICIPTTTNQPIMPQYELAISHISLEFLPREIVLPIVDIPKMKKIYKLGKDFSRNNIFDRLLSNDIDSDFEPQPGNVLDRIFETSATDNNNLFDNDETSDKHSSDDVRHLSDLQEILTQVKNLRPIIENMINLIGVKASDDCCTSEFLSEFRKHLHDDTKSRLDSIAVGLSSLSKVAPTSSPQIKNEIQSITQYQDSIVECADKLGGSDVNITDIGETIKGLSLMTKTKIFDFYNTFKDNKAR